MIKRYLKSLFSNPFVSGVTGDPQEDSYYRELRQVGMKFIFQGVIFMGLVLVADILMSLVFTSGPLFYLSIALFIVMVFYALKTFSGLRFVLKSLFPEESIKMEKSIEVKNKIMEKYHKDTDQAGGRNHY